MGGYGRRVMETIGSTRKEFLKTGFGLNSISKKRFGGETHVEGKIK
jgi:hypothetical protein